MDDAKHKAVEMIRLALCFALALSLALAFSSSSAYADHGTPCRISMSSTLYDSEWNEVDRKSADGRYYPGDGANFLVKWTRDTSCSGFKILQAESYANAVIGPMFEIRGTNHTIQDLPDSLKRSSQDHFELAIIDVREDKDDPPKYKFSWERSGTPKVWTEWVEDDASKEKFMQSVENRCNVTPVEGKQYGCIYGHVELDMKYRGELCYEKRNGDASCRTPVPKIVFSAEGKGKRCTHGEMPTCTTFTAKRSTGKSFAVKQPTLDLILERDPFRDVYGFDVINQDGSFYIDDVMGVLHTPNMTYTKGGAVQFVVEVRGDPRYHDKFPWSTVTSEFDKEWPGIEPEPTLLPPDVVLQCMTGKSCVESSGHPRTDNSNYTIQYGHGKRGYHTLDIGNYTFFYNMSAYNIGTLSDRPNEGKTGNWFDERLLNSTKGYIELHAGPYDPVVSLYGHSIWNASGINTHDAPTGITVAYDGSIEDDYTYPERRMRIDDTFDMSVAYNSTYALGDNGTSVEPYEPFPIWPEAKWEGFDSHDGNYTTIGNRTMMESAGHGTIKLRMEGLFDTTVSNGISTGVVNATGYFTPFTEFLGGIPITWLNNTSYTYPDGYHAVPLNVTVYGSDGNVKPSMIDVIMVQANDTDRTFREYVETKVGEEQDDERITEIVASYVSLNRTVSSSTGVLVTHVPRISHVYITDDYAYNFTIDEDFGEGTGFYPNNVEFYQVDVDEILEDVDGIGEDVDGISEDVDGQPQDSDPMVGPELPEDGDSEPIGFIASLLGGALSGLVGVIPEGNSGIELLPGEGQIKALWDIGRETAPTPEPEESLPLHLGLQSATSPTNMTVTVDGTSIGWDLFDTPYTQPIVLVVNTDTDNEAWFEEESGLIVMRFHPQFGTVSKISDGNLTIPAVCSESCVLGQVIPGTMITANNTWNGTASAIYEVEPVDVVEYVQNDVDELLPWGEIQLTVVVIVAALVILWRLQGGSWPLLGKKSS